MSKTGTAVAIKPETLLVELPHVPEWFERELSQVAQRDGRPMFRIVDGQRELKWRNGKWDVKHLLQHDGVPAYVPVIRELFRRTREDGTHKIYTSYAAAKADIESALLQDIEFSHVVSTRGVGRACWVVEVYIAPEEIGLANWESVRWADLQVNGVVRRVDVLGPFPREGKYDYCFSILDDEGRAISPHRGVIEECKRRWSMVQGERRSVEESIRDQQEREEEFARREIERISDNFYQFHGIAARRLHHGAVSRPITKTYE